MRAGRETSIVENPSIAAAGEESCAGILVGMDNTWVAMLWAILPTIVVSVVFFFILRNVIRMDRTERKVYSRIEAEERAKRGLPPVAPAREGSAN
ncbi:hypothetical protein B0I12_000484 [Microbacterium hydrothermale]|nr:hypothetical protein [Microbacterium hydrothermale]